ncbi:MAG TPA: UTP--glucose-1-phosphate uridylyltransferase [bacterium]|nr:UTP--glucose-1-phosphate uridylyltransferase [bacterium]
MTRDDILRHYPGDLDTFARLQRDFRAGTRTAAGNTVAGAVTPLGAHDVQYPPAAGSAAAVALTARGGAAIKAGQVAVLVLNGGMATRFGSAVKSCCEVYGGKTFLDLKIELLARVARAYGVRLTLLLMNSFATEAATQAHLAQHPAPPDVQVLQFCQSALPRLTGSGDYFDCDRADLCCYGPGHGDFVYALQRQGLLAELQRQGVTTLQFSNLDNLTATLDPLIIGWHLEQQSAMTVEVAEKREGDKGGMPVRVDGKLQLVEGFAFPPAFNQESVRVFNTATYVFALAALARPVDLPWYVVTKEVDGQPVIQFERLAGDLSASLDARYLVVDRDQRFYPIKSQDDLARARERLRQLFA